MTMRRTMKAPTPEQLDRWARLARLTARNARASAEGIEEEVDPDYVEIHRAASRDFDALAAYLEGQLR